MYILEIDNLVKNFKDKKVLKGINFKIKSGDFFALLGYNGAGKSTIIGIITDLIKKDSGKIKINGINIDEDFSKAKSLIGVVPQEFNFNIFSKVKDIPVEQAGYYGIPKKIAIERTEKYLRELGLWEKRDNEIRELSGGMKRRLMIVRALIHEPKLLILDEPTTGIDVELRKKTWNFLKKINKRGISIMLTTHYLEEVELLCNTVAIINKGKIIENTTIKKLLSKLDEELIILNLKNKIHSFSNFITKKYKILKLKNNEIQISLFKNQTINELVKDFDKESIIISNFKNKSNRLEQLFINLIK